MPEVPAAGEDHREVVLVGGGDDLGVALRAARLDHRGRPGGGYRVEPVAEREEGVRRRHRAGQYRRVTQEPASANSSSPYMGNWRVLMLEMIVFSVTIEFVFFERCAQSSQHQLPGFVDASPQFHWDLPEIEHFQCDSGVETRIDLGSRYVNGNTDSRPATSCPPRNLRDLSEYGSSRAYEQVRKSPVPAGTYPVPRDSTSRQNPTGSDRPLSRADTWEAHGML